MSTPRSEYNTMSLGQFREATKRLPDSIPLIAETPHCGCFDVTTTLTIGLETDDPGLIIKLE